MPEIPSLIEICFSSVSKTLFKKHIRWRKLTDVAFEFREIFETLKIPKNIRKNLTSSVCDVLGEVRRWDSKHNEMFVDSQSSKNRVISKGEQLRMFYSSLVWKSNTSEIDDVATCYYLIKNDLKDWPQMQFQFSCLYAKTDWIFDDWKFDKYRRATFKKTLSDHPVYDFWLTLLESRADQFFDTQRRLPNQKLAQCFTFAIRNGYRQLVEYIWNRITDRHREAMGLLEWRTMCLRARDGDAMRFLCEKLCSMNAFGTARIAWSAFYDSFYNMINNEKSDLVVKDQFRRKFEYLLKNSCSILRARVLKMNNCRLLCDSFRYNEQETFSLLLHYMRPEDVASAREFIDRIFDRNKSNNSEKLHRCMIRRQFTIE